MNREVLRGTTVMNGKYYANDALQFICEKLTTSNVISIFNDIVAKGKEFVLKFITNNQELIGLNLKDTAKLQSKALPTELAAKLISDVLLNVLR